MSVPFSPARVLLIAQNTLREAARQKLFHVLVLLAFGLVLGARWLRDFNFGAPELKFIADCGFGAMTFFGSALTIAATAQLFFSELENRTVLTLLSKPVWRAEFILGKLGGILALLAVFCALLTALLAAVLWSREHQLLREMPETMAAGGVGYASVAAAGLLHWLKLGVLAALTLLVASFAQTQLFTVVAGSAVLVIGHVQYLAQEAYAKGGASAGRLVGRALSSVFPNFQLFTLADGIGPGDAPSLAALGTIAGYAAGYGLVAALLAVLCFRRREV